MKKKLVLLLATVMCISLCACGGSETTQTNQPSDEKITEIEKADEAKIEFVEPNDGKEGYYKVYISKEELKKCSSIVTLTMDNWSDYFEDYEYTKHIVKENEFGDKKETDVLVTGFGAKEGMIISVLEDVCFKIKADNADGYLIVKYEVQYGDGYIDTWLVDDLHMPINNMTGKLEDDVPLDAIGKILIFENLPIDNSQIDYTKRKGENLIIELTVEKNTVRECNSLEAVLREYYRSYGLE